MELGPSPKALMQMIQIGIRKLLVPACLVQNLGARQATHKHLRAPARHCSYSCWTILTRGGGGEMGTSPCSRFIFYLARPGRQAHEVLWKSRAEYSHRSSMRTFSIPALR